MAKLANPILEQKPTPILLRFTVVVILAAIMLFQIRPTFQSFFMTDDFRLLDFAKSHESLLNIALLRSPWGFATFIPNIMVWILFRMFGMEPRGYYIFSSLLQFINALLVYVLVRQVRARTDIALTSLGIFMLHFIHFSDWGTLVWISAYNQLVVALFYLCSVNLFVRYVQLKKKIYYAGALVCFGLALGSKETALSLPLLLLAWCVMTLPKMERQWKKLAILLGPFFGIWLLYVAYEFTLQFSGGYVQKSLYVIGPHFFTNWQFFSNLIMPNPTSEPVHNFLVRVFPSWGLALFSALVAFVRLGLVMVGVAAWWKLPQYGRLWITFSILTYLPFIGFADGYAGANRYFYLPAIGFSALVAEGLWWIHDRLSEQTRTRFARLLLVIVFLGYWGSSLLVSRVWQKQMRENSELRQQVIQQVGDYANTADTSITTAYLVDFPDNVRDLSTALQVFYSIKSTWIASTALNRAQLSHDTLVIIYSQDRVIVREP